MICKICLNDKKLDEFYKNQKRCKNCHMIIVNGFRSNQRGKIKNTKKEKYITLNILDNI